MSLLDDIKQLARKHDLSPFAYSDGGVDETADKWVLTLDGLPQLPFYVALADLLEVPLLSITTRGDDHGPGCDTCGYGGGVEYVITVPKSR
jgi:hypothetical protein